MTTSSTSENTHQKEGVFLLFAYPRGQAKGGFLDMKGLFTNIEAAKKGIYEYDAHRPRSSPHAPVIGHVVEIEEGRLETRAFYGPRCGWTWAGNATIGAEWDVPVSEDRADYPIERGVMSDNAPSWTMDLDPSGLPVA